MAKANLKDMLFLRRRNIQSMSPNRQAVRKLIEFIEKPNFYSPRDETEADRISMILIMELIWLNRRIVIDGEHHPRRGELGIVTHIQPAQDIWTGARKRWANLIEANRQLAKVAFEMTSTVAPVATEFDVLMLGIKLDDGNQVKGRKNVDGLYVHLARRVAED